MNTDQVRLKLEKIKISEDRNTYYYPAVEDIKLNAYIPKTDEECVDMVICAMCTRMGGACKRQQPYILTLYKVTPNKTMKYLEETFSCIANKNSWEIVKTKKKDGIVMGRPRYNEVVHLLRVGAIIGRRAS